MFMFDPMYFVFVLPALALAMWAQSRVRGAFEEYSQVRARSGLTGAEVARDILRRRGLDNVHVERIDGELSDHYDPREQVLRLSGGVFNNPSLAALGIAAHETGHALQHSTGYLWLNARMTIIPVTQFGSQAAMPLFIAGLFLQVEPLMTLAIWLFAAVVIFQIITLPVEFNASTRAIRVLRDGGYLQADEVEPAKQVLNAAALTYLAAALMAVMQLLYLLMARRR